MNRRVHAWKGIMGNHGKILRNKAAKCTFFFIFPFRVSFSRRNFYCKRRNPFSVFTSVPESIELDISLLIRVTVKKNSCAHNIHSIDSKTLVNLDKRLLRILYVFRYQIKIRTEIWRKTYILLPCFLKILPWLPIMPLQAWTRLFVGQSTRRSRLRAKFTPRFSSVPSFSICTNLYRVKTQHSQISESFSNLLEQHITSD